MVLLLLLLFPGGLVAAFAFTGYAVGSLGRVGLRAADRTVWLRSTAALVAAVASLLYTWGLLHLVGAAVEAAEGGTDSAPLSDCVAPGQEERASTVVDHTVSYVPLRLVCETSGGGDFTSDTVPGYVNPGVLALALTAAGVAVGAEALAVGRRHRVGQNGER
ncbi:hypothetical protein NFX46_37085 [Streptomyces phaeoluteigriseus]|uniref:Integral membrane protein n=1 Tax=Streptomyces phaeoluteigriseus TaxID=114686 RepID=A0ABY4ZIE0_9ACTN|nr:hypothetical protein [Streptomyces phaeoluteigriseus]USQ88873.1 hypothetical protein NFX46_37085 [Streptomyces phaeoluteigriseus]